MHFLFALLILFKRLQHIMNIPAAAEFASPDNAVTKKKKRVE